MLDGIKQNVTETVEKSKKILEKGKNITEGIKELFK